MILKTFVYIFRRIWRVKQQVFKAYREFLGCGASAEQLKAYAQSLRQKAQKFGLKNHFPVILNEAEHCASCHTRTVVLMQPYAICSGCWIERLKTTIEQRGYEC